MKWLALFCLLLLPLAVAEGHCPEDPDCEPEDPDSDVDGNETEEPENETEDDASDEPGDGDGSDDDADEFEDDDEGFTDRQSGIRYDRSANSFQVPGPTRLDHRFLELVEFEDHDGDGAYDPGERVLARHDLTRAPDSIIGTTDKRITYELGPGQLHLDVRNDGEATKFDVVIQNYGFQSASSRLAVGSSIAVTDGLRTGTVGGDPSLVSAGSGERPYLSWVRNVTVDGREAEVAWSAFVSLDEQGGIGTLYWAYPQGASIVHDPRLGITSVSLERALDATAFLVAAGAAVAFLLAGAVRRR